MNNYLKKIILKHNTFIFFGISGGLAFIVDCLVIWMLFYIGLPYWLARAGSFLCAATFTWQFNKHITFSSRNARYNGWKEWINYILLCAIGGSCNYTASVISLKFWLPHTPFGLLLAVTIGSLFGIIPNYFLSSRWFFKNRKKKSTDNLS